MSLSATIAEIQNTAAEFKFLMDNLHLPVQPETIDKIRGYANDLFAGLGHAASLVTDFEALVKENTRPIMAQPQTSRPPAPAVAPAPVVAAAPPVAPKPVPPEKPPVAETLAHPTPEAPKAATEPAAAVEKGEKPS